MAKIGLSMIVKNESRVIRRCLDSVLPLLDYVLIVDTGSTDGTQAIIRDFLDQYKLPGQVIDEPWQNFAYNRSFALAKLREQSAIDYCLMIDADEVLVFKPGFNAKAFKQGLTASLYDIPTHYGNLRYNRPQLFSNQLPFCFKSVLHEYLDCPDIPSRALVQDFFNVPTQDGARSQNPNKFRDDAALLVNELRTEADPFLIARYTFYLAQSYRDADEQALALEAYLRRAQLGHWHQEVSYSLLNAARLKEALGYAVDETVQTYMAAYEICPDRAEALHGAVRLCRLNNRFHQAYLLGKHGLTLSNPPDALFAEPWIYAYGLLDEFAVSAYWAGHYQEAFDVCRQLLGTSELPASERPRIRENAMFAIGRLNRPELEALLPKLSA